MSLMDIISTGLAPLQESIPIDGGIAIKTHCLYPSNATVVVSVRGGGNEYVVMDDGRALREATTAGAELGKSLKKYERIATKQGLILSNGVVKTPAIAADLIPMAILLVANTSKEVADHIFSTWKLSHKRDFKETVRSLLKQQFSHLSVREEKLVGTSNKSHAFENVVYLGDGRRVIIDPVLHDANSINSRVVANLDLHDAKHEGLEQRLVYDDAENWSSDDLSILHVSRVPVIAFSKAQRAIGVLLAA